MRRGEIWTIAGGSDYAGKPRPCVVLQDDAYAETDSVIVCLLTSDLRGAGAFRPVLSPSEGNGVRRDTVVMAEKLVAAPRRRLGGRAGALDDRDMAVVEEAVAAILGLAR